MAKESQVVSQEDVEEVVVHTPHAHHAPRRTDTKTVVVAVGASVVLFAIGLILGYLLGHQSTNSRGFDTDGNMMNTSGNYRTTMPYRISTGTTN